MVIPRSGGRYANSFVRIPLIPLCGKRVALDSPEATPHSASEALLAIEIRCNCGQVFHADPAHAGRSLRCRCGRTLAIPADAPQPKRPGGNATRSKAPRRRWQLPTILARLVPAPLIRYLPALAWSYLALVVAVASLMWILGDVWWPASVLLFGPRWLLLLPAAPLAAVTLLAQPRLLLPIGLGLLVTLGPVMGFHIGWRRWLSSTPSGSLRLITFNVDAGQNPRLEEVPTALAAYHPDAIVFEECRPRLVQPDLWPPGWTARSTEGGICLVTRLPLLDTRVLERVSTGSQGGTGNAALFRLLAGSDTITVAGIHLETPRKGLESLRNAGSSSRMPVNILVRDAGADRVSHWIRKEGTEPVIAGDFNMPVESRIYRAYFGDCTNAFSTIGTGFGYTRVLHRFSVRIDHVVTCGGWRPLHLEVGPALGSDHRPVIVDLARVH